MAGHRIGFFCNTIAFMFLAVVLGESKYSRHARRITDRVSTVMMFFPTSPNPQLADMNWSVVMYGFVTVVLLVYYFKCGKKSYIGPVIIIEQQRQEASGTPEAVASTGVLHGTKSSV
jgi:hypothetical protein